MGRGQDLSSDKVGSDTSSIPVNIPNTLIRFATLEEAPTKVELVSWSIYGLCSQFAQTFLIPVLFPLLLGQTVKPSANYMKEWDETFPNTSCSNATIKQYERLVHSSIPIGPLKISPLLLTGCVWAITTAILAPILPSLSPFLDYGNKQPIFLLLSSAIGIIACLPPGVFTDTSAMAVFLALAITGGSLSSMAYNRHLALIIRATAAAAPVRQRNSSIIYMQDRFRIRQNAGGLISSMGTAAESVGAAIIATFTYKMLGFQSAVRLAVWITCIFCGILWAVGAAQALLLQPVRSGPDFPGGKFNGGHGWIDAFSFRKFPNAVTSAVLVFLASFAGSCAFASGILHALGHRCFESKYILFMWLAYFLVPALTGVVTGLSPKILIVNGRQMQVIGFLLVAGVSALGFIQNSWRPWWTIVGAGVLGMGVGILNSYGRTLFFDFTLPSKEGFVNARHVKERFSFPKKEEKDHRINVGGSKDDTQNERVLGGEVVELEPDN
ncbi:hypothetical protein SUGI_0794330 [Cryptomeria japonica]|nr:hypothetical protein SUGI_0794330 [Cryptomeria japonica]